MKCRGFSMRIQERWCAIVACLAVVAATAAMADPVTVRDASGRMVTIGDTSRIVSIGGAVTEILYALGMEKAIVAVDTTSLYPPQALAQKPNVGYMRQLSPEGVLGLAPSVIIAIEGAGPRETITVLEAARVPLFLVPDPYTGEGIVQKIRMIAGAVSVPERGECLAAAVQTELAALQALRARIGRPVRVLFVLSFVNGRAMVAGGKTAADGIIRMAGAVNAITEFEGYKPISDEAVVAARPDAVLVMERSGADPLTTKDVFGHAAFSVTPAAASKSLISMNGLYLLGFGPRSARAARDLAVELYPSLKDGSAPADTASAVGTNCQK